MTRPRPGAPVARILLALLLAGAGGPAVAQGGSPGTRPSLDERVEVRLVQVAVAVVDPRSGSRASVPGLTREQFRVLLDGRPLPDALRERLVVDAICRTGADGDGTATAEVAPDAPRSLIAVVDFNYLDARSRHLVAAAIDRLAERGLPPGSRVRVYGLTRQVRRLTDGFVTDAGALRRAAEAIRGEAFTRKEIAAVEGLPDDAVNAGSPLNDPFGSDDAPREPGRLGDELSRRLQGAFGTLAAEDAQRLEQLLGDSAVADLWGDAVSNYDPLASLAALEGIIRAHAAVPGQKALVLFTSEAFRIIREDRLADAVRTMADLARRENVTIFTVDAEGLGGGRRRSSELLSALAGDSGGASLRRTGDLARSFDQAFEQLSCYYLVSVPVPAESGRSTRHTLAVRLDTERFPDLWGLEVRAPTSLTIPSREDRLESDRLAVLFSPEDFPDPPLAAVIEYPRQFSSREVMPVRFRVPLAELTWLPADGALEARVLFEGLLERDRRGRSDIVCRAGLDRAGALTLRRPARSAPVRGGLVFEVFCGFERDGLYTARGVLTDLFDERSGGARATAFVRHPDATRWRADEPRLLAASGRDYLWRSGWDAARLDAGRRAFFPVAPGAPVRAEDRLRFEAVVCGPGTTGGEPVPRIALRRKTGDGGSSAYQGFPADAQLLGQARAGRPFCAPLGAEVDEFSIEPGAYEFVVVVADEILARRAFVVR
ncbi:MAG: hypothetical protein Kow0062_19710 [Acidobacteriota bacterium]